MNHRSSALVAAALAALLFSGCAVTRHQETVGAYVDDTAVTTAVKAKFVQNNRAVDPVAIKVETLNGTVMLSGFAKSEAEKNSAEALTREVNGVKAVQNAIVVRN